MYLCPECFLLGFCRNLKARLVSDAELRNPAFLADIKAYAHAMGIGCDSWPSHLVGLYRDYPGEIVDGRGQPVWLDTELLDISRYWYRDFCKPVANDGTPRLRREAWERVRVLATVLRATDPAGTLLWGIRAANDGPPPAIRPSSPDEKRCAILAAYDIPVAIGRAGQRQHRRRAASPFDADIDDDDAPF